MENIKNRYKFDNSINEKTGKENHLHTLDEKPLIGNTTALKVIAKPLTWWASGLAVSEFGWIKELTAYSKPKPTEENIRDNKIKRLESAEKAHREIIGLNAEDFIKKLDKAYKAHSVKLDKTADDGTDLHSELENYVKLMITDQAGKPCKITDGHKNPKVEIFIQWALKNVKRFIISEGYSYSEKLWVGGIGDLVYEDIKGELVIMDFKSSKEVYTNQFLQNAGLDIMINENGVLDAEGNLIYKLEKPISYYGIFPFGMENPEPSFYYNPEEMKKGYEAVVVLHKLLNIK